ncbi:DUF2482 family protein [Staphylococcus pseudintermedius]|uniref:DUF2482 family protein n=2 Tax=Staphylococcus pseudintermedius TaxID=283734 RepID=UPI0008093987|nr:DUF2482 family protein [Staphylococcus pseudintermedius]ANS90336.1 hypothetical protein A6M57_10100 [Staphylococcus pseudintermedius]EGQ1291847.1 DUF2482 family protein [Staphylococcus pseudintermedius]EGQ1663550.1 DUF2482 family protein [Staphylococcus pseudintermedius]EGQ1690994.1 DUF2482 family protein [Staphylococcus pseudintermedius]EGQ1698627.1 DUF2482 family protein [Staphylococcus pseudintermedius]
MDFKNMTEEQIIEVVTSKSKELYDLIVKVDEETDFNISLITGIALDKGDVQNIFNQIVVGKPLSISSMLVNADNFKKIVESTIAIKSLRDYKENNEKD